MSANGFNETVMDDAKRGKGWVAGKLSDQLAKHSMPAVGNNMYFQASTASLSGGIDTLRTSGLGGFDQARIGAGAALDYFTGMDTSRVAGRAQARIAEAGASNRMGGLQVAGTEFDDAMKAADDAGRSARMKALDAGHDAATGARMRGARAGVRMGALGAGIAALDFLNPFSFGWND